MTDGRKGEEPVLDGPLTLFLFLPSPGGTGRGSAYMPFLASRASFSDLPAWYPLAHASDTTSISRP